MAFCVAHVIIGQLGNQRVQRLLAALAPHHQLCDHRIVVDGHFVALADAGFDANAGGGWVVAGDRRRCQVLQRSGTGQKSAAEWAEIFMQKNVITKKYWMFKI